MSSRVAVPKPAEAQKEAVAPVITPARSVRLHKRCACGGDSTLSGQCESCANRNKLSLQRRSDGGGAGGGIPGSVHQTLAQPGRPLESASRGLMEARFGQDFSGVRVHDDAAAARSAEDVHALAYTVGQDIVFAPGQYQPQSESGRHLLAHELAHTVQQKGLQRSGTASLVDQGPEYRRLEAEADLAADLVARATPLPQPATNPHQLTTPLLHSASRPTLSRTPAAGAEVSASGAGGLTPKPLTVRSDYMTTTHLVTPSGGFERGGDTQQSFTIDKLFVPASKGPRALPMYENIAGGSLQAVLSVEDSIRAQQWQQRDDTSGLQARWLQIVGWQAGADANSRWQAVGGDATFPRVGNATCQMDHIVELQIGGTNINENIQALDAEQNRDSGGAIKNQVFGLARQIHQDRDLTDGTAIELQLTFGGVQLVGTPRRSAPEVMPTSAPPASPTCLSVEFCARRATGAAAPSADAAALDDYKLSAGGTQTTLRVPSGFSSSRTASSVAILDDATNASSAELISGLLLKTLRHPASGNDRIEAGIDTRDRTRLPLTLEDETRGVEFTVGPPAAGGFRPLNLRTTRPNIRFAYPYLSPGRVTQLSVTPQGQVNWRGEIDSRVPFLPRPLSVIYENESLRVGVELNRQTLRRLSPIPGFTLTDARLDMSLTPTLSASGRIEFAIGRGASAIATGFAEVTADSSGLSATGQLRARIPGVDEASGTITYRDGAWSGQIIIESSQIRIPNVQRGRLQLDIDESGMRPSGEVELLLPRNLGNATLGFSREGERFVYTGRGTLRVPGLREVEIRARYDGRSLRANANNVGFRWRGLDGSIDVVYAASGDSPGRITGTGRLRIARGDVTGSIQVTLHDNGRFSGEGRVTYPFTIQGQRIEATAGITVDPEQQVRVSGSLRFPQPIQLFRRFGDNKTLFEFHRSIPIPGLSIGPVGVVAVIRGGVSARYWFGPGELRNVALEGAFNPLAENIDPTVSFHCELHIPAEVGIAGTIGGGIGVEAGLGRVEGTLTVTADLGLNATLGGPLDLRYENRRFDVTARPGIDAALGLGLSLDAQARAEAGFGPFTIGIEKNWNLGRRTIVLGRFSMHAPIGWSSDGGFTAPTMDQIEWGPMPDINPGDLLSQLFSSSSARERET